MTPYSESYTLSVEREVARDTVLTASYIGTQAHHLLVLISANPGDPALCLSLSRPENVMPGTATCGPFGESGTYTTRSGQVIQGTRGPFDANFAAITYQKTIGNSNYNALEVSLRHAEPVARNCWSAIRTENRSINHPASPKPSIRSIRG